MNKALAASAIALFLLVSIGAALAGNVEVEPPKKCPPGQKMIYQQKYRDRPGFAASCIPDRLYSGVGFPVSRRSTPQFSCYANSDCPTGFVCERPVAATEANPNREGGCSWKFTLCKTDADCAAGGVCHHYGHPPTLNGTCYPTAAVSKRFAK